MGRMQSYNGEWCSSYQGREAKFKIVNWKIFQLNFVVVCFSNNDTHDNTSTDNWTSYLMLSDSSVSVPGENLNKSTEGVDGVRGTTSHEQ